MPTYSSVGSLFYRKRLEAELSQHELATRAQTAISTISRLETGLSVPRARNLAKLAFVLSIAPEQLENFGQDTAADHLRGSLSGSHHAMRKALTALIGAEAAITELGFRVQLSQPEEGTLLLRCELDGSRRDGRTKTALPEGQTR